MARTRNLKIGFFENETLAQLPDKARLLYAGLWLLADRSGRLEDRPLRIRGQVFPYEMVDCEQLLALLAEHGFIRRYVVQGSAGEVRVIDIPKFLAHQNPHPRETSSKLPAFSQSLGSATAEPNLGAAEQQPSRDRSGIWDLGSGDLRSGDLRSGRADAREDPRAREARAAKADERPALQAARRRGLPMQEFIREELEGKSGCKGAQAEQVVDQCIRWALEEIGDAAVTDDPVAFWRRAWKAFVDLTANGRDVDTRPDWRVECQAMHAGRCSNAHFHAAQVQADQRKQAAASC